MMMRRCNILATLILLACLSCSTDKDTAFTRMERLFANDSVKHGIAEYYNQFAPYHHGVSRTLVDSLGQPTDINYKAFPTDTAFREYLTLNSYKYVEGPSLPDEVAMTDGALERRINAMAEVKVNSPTIDRIKKTYK